MNKDEISRRVYEAHGGMAYADAREVVDRILDAIKNRLANGERVVLSGFGSFTVQRRKDKKGVNPQTGRSIIIPGRNTVKFKPSKYLKSV
ncbi:MAG: HU family DNA-binding protein [Acidobacteria bacterium]|nr:HU family DNA-binding protein [Acidobacteriota bacterium]